MLSPSSSSRPHCGASSNTFAALPWPRHRLARLLHSATLPFCVGNTVRIVCALLHPLATESKEGSHHRPIQPPAHCAVLCAVAEAVLVALLQSCIPRRLPLCRSRSAIVMFSSASCHLRLMVGCARGAGLSVMGRSLKTRRKLRWCAGRAGGDGKGAVTGGKARGILFRRMQAFLVGPRASVKLAPWWVKVV
jgi:hypothetical protein